MEDKRKSIALHGVQADEVRGQPFSLALGWTVAEISFKLRHDRRRHSPVPLIEAFTLNVALMSLTSRDPDGGQQPPAALSWLDRGRRASRADD